MKDRGPGGSSAQIKTKVFISYSRRDMAWADWIVDALQKSGVEALIDREDIEKGEDFQKRIFSLINQADTIVYLITPNSVASKFCNIEVDYAESLNKRFVPLLLQPVSDAQGRPFIDANAQPLLVPDALARINWVPFNEGSDANASMGDLLKTLFTDLKWVREHTRLGEHALRWQKSGAPASQLLRGKDLDACEQWRDTHPKNARPPTELQLQFIAASRKGAGKRRNMLVGSLVAGLVVAVGLGGLAFWQRGVAQEQTQIAKKNEQVAKKQTQLAKKKTAEAEQNLKQSMIFDSLNKASQAAIETEAGDAVNGMLLAINGMKDERLEGTLLSKRPYVSETEYALTRARSQNRELRLLKGHRDKVLDASFSPDGKMIVTASDDKTARIWSVETGKLIRILEGHREGVASAMFSPDGSKIATASVDSVWIWSTMTGKVLRVLNHSQGGTSPRAVFSPDGQYILTSSSQYASVLWDVSSGKKLQTYDVQESAVDSLDFSPDGKKIATGFYGGYVIIWEALTGKMLRSFRPGFPVSDLQYSRNGKFILTAGLGVKTVVLWEIKTGKMFAEFAGDGTVVKHTAFSPDNKHIVGTSDRHTAWISRTVTGKVEYVLRGHVGPVNKAVFSPNGRLIVTGSDDGTARIWDANKADAPQILTGRDGSADTTALSFDSKLIVAGFNSGSTVLWRASTGEKLHVLNGHKAAISKSVFSPDGKYVGTASQDGTARIWMTSTGKILHVLKGHCTNGIDLGSSRCSLDAVAFSPDGKSIVTGATDRTARLWDVASGKVLRVFEGHDYWVGSVDFSPDGKFIVTASTDGTARIWDIATGKMLHMLGKVSSIYAKTGSKQTVLDRGDKVAVNNAVFSADGKHVATSKDDGTASLWDVVTGNRIRDYRGHTDSVASVDLSADGRYVVTASADTTIRIWEKETGKILSILRGHRKGVSSAKFSLDSQYLLSTSRENNARLWDVKNGKPLRTFEFKTGSFYSTAAISPDSRYVVIGGSENRVGLWRIERGQDLMEEVKGTLPRCLTLQQREKFFLQEKPPRWCITGAGREKEPREKWVGKWPYHTRQWQDWLASRDDGQDVSMPAQDDAEQSGASFANQPK